VRYSAAGEPLNVHICHCRICQKATGQPFFARALYSRGAVKIDGQTKAYRSTPELARHFCPRCGTPIFTFREDADVVGVALGTFDEPCSLPPEANVFTTTEIPWLASVESLPKFPSKAA
jgi:hypothetical protein